MNDGADWYRSFAQRLPERGTGKCRESPYDKDRHNRNKIKQERNKRNRINRTAIWKSGKEREK